MVLLTKRVVNGVTHEYFYDGNNLIAEKVGDKYFYFFYDESGVCGFRYENINYEYVKNIFGDIIGIYNEYGTHVATYAYDAWGNMTYCNAGTDVAYINPFLYRGYYYDSESGLYYLMSRYYDTQIGRFISPDMPDYLAPDTVGGVDLYAYGLNNPVTYVDPTGHFAIASLLISMTLGALASGLISTLTQLGTTGTVDPAKVAVSALFGGASAGLSFIGIGGVLGQFAIQGALSVGESITTDLLEGNTIDGDAIGGYVLDFLVGGALGAIGSKDSFKEFKRIGQIENSLTGLVGRSFKKKGFKEAFKTLGKKSGKYVDDFLKPTVEENIRSLISIPIDVGLYWFNKGIEFVF